MDEEAREKLQYLSLHNVDVGYASGADEQLRTAPLISLTVKTDTNNRGNIAFPQYGFLGCSIPSTSTPSVCPTESTSSDPILLNTNTPWSAFLCGSQGSGKSYTLAVMLENCLYPSPNIGKLPKPLAGIVFHHDTHSAGNICEAAHLASMGVKVNVLVSKSNQSKLEPAYSKAIKGDGNKNIQIYPLMLSSQHLDIEAMYRLMAFSDSESVVPLYMEVIYRILREMAMTKDPFNYKTFREKLKKEKLHPGQEMMMNMRLNLLESFLDMASINHGKMPKQKNDMFIPQAGSLTIVDLSDKFVNPATACSLFDICLNLFEQNRPASGMVVALDEAHKFMNKSGAADSFTEHILTTIREQRHNATRIIIATQEPTISPKLLDLCSMTFVHRFTSPDWLSTLRTHLAAASSLANTDQSISRLFEEIIELNAGESLLFAPSAVLEISDGKPTKLGMKKLKFKTRMRLGSDGGRSVLAIRNEKFEDIE